MRKLFILQCILFSFIASSQITSIPSSSSLSQTRYEGVSVNESSGRVVQNIPLFNYSVGKLSVPVSLNYVGNGVKVVQQSNWVGTNWNLSAGGIVTRIVNNYPDEKASQRIFFEQIESLGTEQQGSVYLPTEDDTRDFKADLFSFSFPGYSGSFYLDQNMNPRLMDNNVELKIEFFGGLTATNNNTILITTPNGEKYYFGGVNASERTSTLITTPYNSNEFMDEHETQQIAQTVAPLATTAFYLFKIENSYGNQILIDYYDDGEKKMVLFEQQELPLLHGEEYIDNECFDIEGFQLLKKAVYHGTIHNSKKIKRIYSNTSDFEVEFSSTNLFLPSDGIINTPQYNDRILNSILLKNTSLNENIKKIKLDYLMPNGTNSSRFFLEKISIFNSFTNDTTACESYRFEYNAPQDLPSRFSRGIDLLGYYNAFTNTTLIAQNQNLEFDNAFQNLAVRTPNFGFASKGVLKKMYTPTGGVTEFEYESPNVNVVNKVTKTLRVYRNKSGYSPTVKISDSFNIGGEIPLEPSDPVLYNPKDQVMYVNLNAVVDQIGSFHLNKIIVEVKDMTNNTVQTQDITLVHQVYIYNKVFSFPLIKDHAYLITLKQSPTNPTSVDAPLEAYAVFYYEDYKNFEAMGLRIKSTKNFLDSNSTISQNIKRYYYKKVKDFYTSNDDSAVVTFNPKFDNGYKKYCCELNNVEYHFDAVSLISDPFSHYFASADNQTEYKCVTISYGGDYFEQGGVEKHFKVEKRKDIEPYLYGSYNYANPQNELGASFDNSDTFNGTLLKEKLIEYSGGNLVFKGETEYVYNQTIDHEIKSVSVIRNREGCIYPNGAAEFSLDPAIGHYSNYSFRNNLISIVNKEYIDAVPVSNGVAGKVISSTREFEYSSLRGLPKKIKNKDSKGNSIITEYLYPVAADLSSVSVDSLNQAAYTLLNNQNNIAIPLQTTLKKVDINGVEKTLSTTRNLFLATNDYVLPQKVLTAKANAPLKSNIEFTTYDNKNNLVEVTQENQLKKSIIYGYNDQVVIAELTNVEYNDIGTAINDLKVLSDGVASNTATESQLFNALNLLRTTFPNAQIATNVYDKYLRLKSSTDARGYTVYFDYDECSRLRVTKDQDGNIIEEHKYNLKNN